MISASDESLALITETAWTRADLQQRVRTFVLSNFYVPATEQMSDEQSLIDSGIVDSTGVLELVAFLEAEFGIKIEDEELVPANLGSIAQMATFVQDKASRGRNP